MKAKTNGISIRVAKLRPRHFFEEPEVESYTMVYGCKKVTQKSDIKIDGRLFYECGRFTRKAVYYRNERQHAGWAIDSWKGYGWFKEFTDIKDIETEILNYDRMDAAGLLITRNFHVLGKVA